MLQSTGSQKAGHDLETNRGIFKEGLNGHLKAK